MAEKHKHIWVLDASFGDVVRIEIPENFPENGNCEKLIEEAFEADGNGRRLTDCDWMISKVNQRQQISFPAKMAFVHDIPYVY